MSNPSLNFNIALPVGSVKLLVIELIAAGRATTDRCAVFVVTGKPRYDLWCGAEGVGYDAFAFRPRHVQGIA